MQLGYTVIGAESEAGKAESDGMIARVWRFCNAPNTSSLIVWAAISVLTITMLFLSVGADAVCESRTIHLLLEICSSMMVGGIIYCLWVQYCSSCERWILLAAVGFAGLLIGSLVHALSLLVFIDGFRNLLKFGMEWQTMWIIASAVIFIFAARSRTVHGKEKCRRIGRNTLIGFLVPLALVFTAGLIVTESSFGIGDRITGVTASIMHSVAVWSHSLLLVRVISLLVLITACAFFAYRYVGREDSFSDGMAKFLLLFSVGQAVLLTSPAEYNLCWWMWHASVVASLSLLLIRLGKEFGASYADAHARIEHLEAVHYMSTRLSNTLDLRVVLLAMVSDTASMLSARFASVMLADDAGESLTTAVTHGLPEDPLNPAVPKPVEGAGRPDFYSGHTAKAFRERRICVVDDVYTDVEFVPWRLLAHCDGYAVSVPLVYQEVALGVMNLFFDRHVPLNDERIRLFQTLASAAAVAIVNAQLYNNSIQAHCDVTTWHLSDRLAS